MSYRFGHFRLSIIRIVDNENYLKNAYPFYYVQLGRIIIRKSFVSYGFLILFSRDISITYFRRARK